MLEKRTPSTPALSQPKPTPSSVVQPQQSKQPAAAALTTTPNVPAPKFAYGQGGNPPFHTTAELLDLESGLGHAAADSSQVMPGAFPDSPQHLAAGATDQGAGGGWNLRMPSLRKAVSGPMTKMADQALGLGKDSSLSKQTTAWSSLVFSKSKSTISEPRDMAGKAADVFAHVATDARTKVARALPQRPDAAQLARPEMQALSTGHCRALTTRLNRATNVLRALAQGTTREELHELTTSKLEPTTFPASAAMVKRLSAAYQDRQVTGVHRSREAHVEQGIKTLNLVHEAAELHAAVAPAVPVGGAPAAQNDLHTAAGQLNTSRVQATNGLNGFRADYTHFVQDELGCTVTDSMQGQIDRIADVRTSPADRNALHADVMARAVAGQRIEEGLNAVTDPLQREALRSRIDGLQHDAANPQRGDRHVIDLVHELTGRTGLGQSDGAAQFLERMTALKGAPLDETLRVHKDIYRTAYQPTRAQGEEGELVDWKEARVKDVEKVNAELTSIALHVRQANRLGTLDTQLAAAFPGTPVPAECTQIKQNFEASCERLVQRQPGEPVSAQDKLNIKLAKSILDNGAAIRDIAGQLQYLQESYATDLDRSPDMKKLLASGSSGASYDPVEQRANARTRLNNLQMGILDVKQSAGEAYVPRKDVSGDVIRQTIQQAEDIMANPSNGMDAAKLAELDRHLFLMKNYVREANSNVSGELLTQLADNDPRCGTDAVVAENLTAYGNGGISFGGKHESGFSAAGGLDATVAGQMPAPAMLTRNEVPNSIVLTESTAYSIKSVCNLTTHSYKGTLKGALAMGYSGSEQEGRVVKSALSFGGGEAVGCERVVIENPTPGLACMVHKAPVLDGTKKNDKISNGTYIGMNDTVNRALFQPVQVEGVTPVASDVPGWNNLNHFFAATDRATLEPLKTKREVTLTLTHQPSGQVGGSFSNTTPGKAMHQGLFAGRLGVGLDAKFGHAYREELIQTPTLDKLTTSDTFSQTHTATTGVGPIRISGSAPLDGGATYAAALAADTALAGAKLVSPEDSSVVKHLTDVAETAHAANSAVPKVRYGSQIDVAKLSRGVEHARDYKEDYKRVVRDQFGNEIPSLVRDSRQATDGRLLVNNIVNEVGLLNATMAQRVDSANMSAVEKQTVTKLLCLSTIASHYQNAGALDRDDPPNDNLTINVTASLSPAAAARHAAVKGRFGRQATEGEGAGILANSLNYQTLGAAGGFKNQNTTVKINGAMARTKRSTSSAQSAGYPSGVDVISEEAARRFDTFLREPRNSDVREALQSVGLGEPLQLLADYNALTRTTLPSIATTPKESIVEGVDDEGMPDWMGDLEAGTYIPMKDLSSIPKPIGSTSGASPGSPDEKPPFDPPPTNTSGTSPGSSTPFTTQQGPNADFTEETRGVGELSPEKRKTTEETLLANHGMQRAINNGDRANCLIISLLQHASNDYRDHPLHRDRANALREELNNAFPTVALPGAYLRFDQDLDPNHPRSQGGGTVGSWLVGRLAETYPDRRLNVTFVNGVNDGRGGTLIGARHETYPDNGISVAIFEQGEHFDALRGGDIDTLNQEIEIPI